MTSVKRSKINQLLRVWPVGTVATTPWLSHKGIYQQLAYEYERSGWLQHLGSGAYIRSGDEVEWPGGVYALQKQLALPVHVGGKTALELKGLGHFVAAGEGTKVYLFASSGKRLPSWFLRHDWKRKIVLKTPRLFDDNSKLALTTH